MHISDISRHSLETAYCFMHQKQRVYQYSNMDWQRDDIECAISSFVDEMDPCLYSILADKRSDFLLSHARFGEDLLHAVQVLESMLFGSDE